MKVNKNSLSNNVIHDDGSEPIANGFYAARQIFADNAEEAATEAILILLKEINDEIGLINIDNDIIFEIEEIEEIDNKFTLNNKGMTFY